MEQKPLPKPLPKQKQDKLKLYYKATNITNLGVGNRAVYWLQGCSLNCDGCLAKDSQSFEQGEYFLVDDLLNELEVIYKDLEGITISGGEPFEQKEALSYFINLVKNRFKKLSIMVFSGYRLEELLKKNDKDINEILKRIDILIDGRFDKTKQINEPWRGSINQKIWFLTNRYDIEDYKKEKVGVDIIIKDGEIFEVGIPKKE